MSQAPSHTLDAVPEPQRAAALAMVWSELPPDLRRSLFDAAVAESGSMGPGYWSGLVASWHDGQMTGVAWVQPHAGRVGSIHGPLVAGGDPLLAAELVRFSVEQARRINMSCIQSLLPAEHSPQADALATAGFGPIAELLYMFSDEHSWPTQRPHGELKFRPASADELAVVVEQTYQGSLDCPAVDGLRSMDDVLAGYRATGNFQPENLQIAELKCHAEVNTVGCLLLADHPCTDQIELVYMGVVPAARGHRWGEQIVRQAQWLTRQRSRKRLVLAVDEANRPGVRMYAATGFFTFDRKRLWLRKAALDGNVKADSNVAATS